jgi:hypothetical protein
MIKDLKYAESVAASNLVVLGYESEGPAAPPVFHKVQDREAFLSVLALAEACHPVKILAFCLMPSRFQFVLDARHVA